jgi:PGF-pre-PGF domain-containing protein
MKLKIFLIFILISTIAFAATNDNNNNNNNLFENNEQTISVIIELEKQNNQNQILSIQDTNNINQINNLNKEHQIKSTNSFSTTLTKQEYDKLKQNNKIKNIYLNEDKHIFLDSSTTQVNSDDVNALTINNQFINGTGYSVCVIDTGANYSHTNLGGCSNETFANGTCQKVIGGYDFCADNTNCLTEDNNPEDVHGHGTHVSGIIASTNPTYTGIAPGASIVAMKVCNSAGSCPDSAVLSAIERCINNATVYNITAISMSLGGGQYTTYCDANVNAQYATLISNATKNNISVIVATGNTDATYTNATGGIASPACVFNSTRVSATNAANTAMASFAFRHPGFTDIITAPGSGIISLALGSGTASSSGTSMATPHVSAMVALFNQYFNQVYSINITPAQLKLKLNNTGTIIDDTSNSQLNIPTVDILAALTPTITFISPTPTNNSTLSVSYTTINITSDINLSNAILELNFQNTTITNYSMTKFNSTNFNYTLEGLTNSNYSYKVYGNDSLIIAISNERLLFTDQDAPNVTFINPTNNTYINSNITLNITISNNQLDYANYSITNSSDIQIHSNSTNNIAQSSYEFTDIINFSNSTFNDDNYTLTVFTNDTFSNETTSTITIIVDKTKPSLYWNNISLTTIYNTNNVTFKVNITDTYLNTSSIILETNFSGTWQNFTMANENLDTYNFTIIGANNFSNNQTIFYQFYATDLASNQNQTQTFNFSISNRVPYNANITSHTPDQVIELSNDTTFTANATDDDSDSLTYQWQFSQENLTGQSITTKINQTGNVTVILTVNDTYDTNQTNVTVFINDTKAPIATLSYDTSVHLESESTQNMSATFLDYSAIYDTNLTFNSTIANMTCTQSTNQWNCTWNLTQLSVGSYNFTLNFTDNFSTRHTNSTQFTFVVTSCSDSTQNGDETGTDCGGSCSAACSAGGSSSGGGGGGSGGGSSSSTTSTTDTSDDTTPTISLDLPDTRGAVTTTPPTKQPEEVLDVIEQEPQVTKTIQAKKGTPSTINIEKSNVPIKSVKINSKVDRTLTLDVKSLKEKPNELLAPTISNKYKQVYQYLEIDLNLEKEEIEEVKVKFEIPSEYFTQNNLNPQSIVLVTYENGKWVELTTKITSNTHVVEFESTLEHFSIFAILVKEKRDTMMYLIYSVGGLILLLILLFIIRKIRN